MNQALVSPLSRPHPQGGGADQSRIWWLGSKCLVQLMALRGIWVSQSDCSFSMADRTSVKGTFSLHTDLNYPHSLTDQSGQNFFEHCYVGPHTWSQLSLTNSLRSPFPFSRVGSGDENMPYLIPWFCHWCKCMWLAMCYKPFIVYLLYRWKYWRSYKINSHYKVLYSEKLRNFRVWVFCWKTPQNAKLDRMMGSAHP